MIKQLWILLGVLFFLSCKPTSGTINGISINPENPHYLLWDETPVFLLGATGYHSWTPVSRPAEVNFIEQLDRLAKVIDDIGSPHVRGFVRCLPYDPMNHMHDGEVEKVLQPWLKLDDGRYDLAQFEPEWEKRLRDYLNAAFERHIVVSLEVWDDWSVTRGPGGAYDPGEGNGWNGHPFNPKNNVNFDETILSAETSVCNAPFYKTIPKRNNNTQVLSLQKKYVDRLLSVATNYPNVILNISNESRAHLDWSRFWAGYIREKVPSGFMIGEMPSTNRKDGGGECEYEFSPLNLCTEPFYDFVDISQGVSSHEFGPPSKQAIGAGERILQYRQAMAEAETQRPLIVSKDYSRDENGGDMVLWSRFVSGAASARFHRPAGDDPESVIDFQHAAIGRLGRFIAKIPFWQMSPNPGIVVKLPEGTGANVLAEPASVCAIQLIGAAKSGSVYLDLSPGNWNVQWIDPSTGNEINELEVSAGESPVKLDFLDGKDHRIILLKKKSD
ncbi:hypothetical protein SAMN05444280_102101 [Tangfeifania diversioriginum]|uniref:Collagen-binding domain of a collagenase n=1 Tax=Tangfeifania diversioriginum TaxID=1168035 RepID=A0A1M6B689_9BACT|nr:hypothetical protein [Tangfeifania diversioriginum]SHI44225.1 hypothetical protein SAMN05444280_102101 [Tangfeifania diversioriginum]